MITIQILHRSLLGYGIRAYIDYYFKRHPIKAAKIVSSKHINYKYKSNIYFIIKSFFMTSNQMYKYLDDIRLTHFHASIIIIGSHIDYEEIFKKHYRVFGVIDTTTNKSFTFIRDQISFYLDSLYNSKKL
ncbi:hypothetical protein [Streptococcus halichoeri]|uniref:hypothetical protein n=3 Tax=Streptococcus halichoeri TaxID=254785 RepID=UPI001F16CA53|nr:hypothetical protein [Streptococcus halichoeri]